NNNRNKEFSSNFYNNKKYRQHYLTNDASLHHRHQTKLPTTTRNESTKLPTITNNSFLINQSSIPSHKKIKQNKFQFNLHVQRPLSPLPEKVPSPQPPQPTQSTQHLLVPTIDSRKSSHKAFSNTSNLVSSNAQHFSAPNHMQSGRLSVLKGNTSSLPKPFSNNNNPIQQTDAGNNSIGIVLDHLKRRRSSAIMIESNTSTLKSSSTNRFPPSDIEDLSVPDHSKRRRSSVMDGNLRRASRIIDRFEQQELAKEIQQQQQLISTKNKAAFNSKNVYDELRHCRYLRFRDEYQSTSSGCPCNKCEKKH
ncbi:MAG: hypothetical protein AAFY76_22495, partial [Cyanobacteria bacterium J06649_11]